MDENQPVFFPVDKVVGVVRARPTRRRNKRRGWRALLGGVLLATLAACTVPRPHAPTPRPLCPVGVVFGWGTCTLPPGASIPPFLDGTTATPEHGAPSEIYVVGGRLLVLPAGYCDNGYCDPPTVTA